jgi:hypothetical protein
MVLLELSMVGSPTIPVLRKLQGWGHPGLHSEALPQKQKAKTKQQQQQQKDFLSMNLCREYVSSQSLYNWDLLCYSCFKQFLVTEQYLKYLKELSPTSSFGRHVTFKHFSSHHKNTEGEASLCSPIFICTRMGY